MAELPDLIVFEFILTWRFKGQTKTTAKGESIKTEKIGGRTTYYTDAQELYH